jgi:hypothetical protein
MAAIFTQARTYSWIKPAGVPCRKRNKKVNSMRNTGILIAGIFLACVVCAGIPAVAAADNPHVIVNTHITEVPQVTQQEAATISTPAPWWQTLPQQGAEQLKTWWNTIWQHQQTAATPQVSVTPTPTPAAPPDPQKG